MTSPRNTIRASCHPRKTILGHSLYDLCQGTGNKVFYAPACSYSMLYNSISTVSWFLQRFIIVEYKLQYYMHAYYKNRMLQNCGIDAHRRLSRLLKRPSTCYEAQNVRHLVSPLNQNRRVLSPASFLLLLISGISAIRSIEFCMPGIVMYYVRKKSVDLYSL